MTTRHISSLFCCLALSALFGVIGCGGSGHNPSTTSSTGTSTGSGSGSGTTGSGSGSGTVANDKTLKTEDVATGLFVPWSLQFAPDGRLFFTETPGYLSYIPAGGGAPQRVADIHTNTPGGEAGLTGMALDPQFANNNLLYVHYCYGSPLSCKVAQWHLSGSTTTETKVLLDYPVSAPDHTGGRLKIGPDGFLYLTTGDHTNTASAQDLNSLNGKILRMALDGTPAPGNPFPSSPLVYALGFRDPQGIAWDANRQLYASDNGPTNNDEIDLVKAGGNYGWPTCVGTCNNPQFQDPIKLWPNYPMPPSGITFYQGNTIPGWNGSLLVAIMGLAGNQNAHEVHQLFLNGASITSEQDLWQNKFGRIRDITEGPDGFVYFSTTNNSSNVPLNPGDDRIVRAHP